MKAIFAYNPTDEFEQLYTRLREKEGRVCKDEEVATLPEVDTTHPYYEEWEIRKRSLKRLQHYIQHKKSEPDILEVGCGNGWLSAQLAAVTKGKVLGIDVNSTELEQAQRVFKRIPNLEFMHCSLHDEQLQDKNFDIIVFADAVQYFYPLKKLISTASAYLTLQGEIHITDSNFYKQNEIAAARERTKAYFRAAGFEEMESYYFHYSIEGLERFNAVFLFDPNSFLNRFTKNKNPFYHVVIKNRY